jgi:hypothetical protein
MRDDPYDIDLRMCDDAGLVSSEPVVDGDTLDGSYIERFLRLKRMTSVGRENLRLKPEQAEGGWGCTGHAHLAGLHIRCTSPWHRATVRELAGSLRPLEVP